MTVPLVLAAAAGLALGVGLVLVWLGLPAHRRVGLTERIEPYVRDAPRPSRLLAGTQEVSWSGLLGSALTAVAAWLDRVLGGSASIRSRLVRAGASEDVAGFRVAQVLWALTAAGAAALLGSGAWVSRGTSPAAVAAGVVCAGIGGAVARDQALSARVTRREQELMAEFPALAELLSLAVTAGEAIVPALERAARVSSGPLSSEIATALVETRSGVPLATALHRLAARVGVPAVTRFVDALVVAVERGTPLSDVLRAQAQDAREAGRQHVIESGGKREIAMMVPVVFLVLPVTVLFAIYPGLTMLRLSL